MQGQNSIMRMGISWIQNLPENVKVLKPTIIYGIIPFFISEKLALGLTKDVLKIKRLLPFSHVKTRRIPDVIPKKANGDNFNHKF
ncbi:hypothetical protein X474_06520 [Dethiosulfatarculus sandiegensis]|uniref:Uncharacterized protein n=1 Tax=Dethiosulfatarculus sandiegensis TaxID=1429043 RepID=A0A0D2HWP0_9BACT|nr:hypothetical protein X474_06520 [Dethiosulfatarculus sandiegensis]